MVIGRQVVAIVRGDQSGVIFDSGLELVIDIYMVAMTLKWWSKVAEVMIRMINRAQSGGRWWLATTSCDVLIDLFIY
jgi:hypothetical protein